METDNSTNSSGNILKIEEIEEDEILKSQPSETSTLRPVSPTSPDLAITSFSRSPSDISPSNSPVNMASGNPSSMQTAVEYMTGNEDPFTESPGNVGLSNSKETTKLEEERQGSPRVSSSPKGKSKRVSLKIDRPHSATMIQSAAENEEERDRNSRPRGHSITVTKPLRDCLSPKEKKRSRSPLGHNIAAKLRRTPRQSHQIGPNPPSLARLRVSGEEQDMSVSSESISWSSCQSKKSIQDFSRTSSNSGGSLSPSPTTRLLPLPSATICVERSFRLGSQHFINTVEQLESCFTDRHLRVYVCTWNMEQIKDLPRSIEDLLLPPNEELASDVYVIGSQESTSSRGDWEILIQQTLGPSYVLVHSAVLGIIYLEFFLRRELIWYCSAVEISYHAVRPVTAFKTKGAVGVRFTLFGSTFLFITSHFMASQNHVEERNSNMKRIAANLFPSISEEGDDVTAKCDYVFWCGDLNYRVDLDRKTADDLIARRNYVDLLMEDQLTKEMLQDNVFQNFSEQPVNFPPSYKYDVGTDIYDTSEKQRIPSWTDRILFRSRAKEGITGIHYNHFPKLKISDHKPVFAIFRVKLEPSTQIEGIADTMASFNREVYLKAIRLRKRLTQRLSHIPVDENDGGPTTNVIRGTKKNSQVCTIL